MAILIFNVPREHESVRAFRARGGAVTDQEVRAFCSPYYSALKTLCTAHLSPLKNIYNLYCNIIIYIINQIKNFRGEINSNRRTHEKIAHTVDGLTGEENFVNM